jgi:hypothetical protein
MSYAQFGTVQATDFNTLVGGNPTTTSGTLNAVWATGGGAAGYGQTALANVTAGQTVASTGQWSTLVANTASAATHQGSSITAVTAPVAGGTITYLSAIPTNLTTIYTNRLNAATQGSTSTSTVTTTSTWSDKATWTQTATFANGDAARYFFNSGGQLKLTMSHPSGTGINLLLNALAFNVGTLVLSAPSSGTITVASTAYTGFTKIPSSPPGGSTPSPYLTNNGYYALTAANANVFLQTASTGPSAYLSTNINVLIKSNGTQGSNSDAGSVITIYTVWDEIPNGFAVATGSTVTLTAQAPETTNLANTWGTITLAGSVSVV